MKSLKIFVLVAVFSLFFIGCDDAGVASKRLNGDEQDLPDELKGLSIYNVSISGGNYVKVAVIDGKINSTTYQVGKAQESVVIVNKKSKKAINVSQILLENDSLIVFRK